MDPFRPILLHFQSNNAKRELFFLFQADRPARAHHLYGRVPTGERSNRIRRRLEERPNVEGPQDPHGLGQEAYDAECAAFARALQVAATRNHTTDCQAAIGRMAPEARRTSPPFGPRSPTSRSRSGGAQATRASRETRLPTNGPSSRQTNRMPTGLNPSSTSSEGSLKGDGRTPKAGPEACPHQQPQIPAKRKAETGPHGGQGQQAPRLPVLPAEDGTLLHRAIPRVDDPPPRRHLLVVSVQHPDSGAPLQKLPPMEEPTEDSLGDRPRDPQAPRPGDRTNIAELLADQWCSQAVLDFLATTDVGRTAGPPVANEEADAAGEASEWEARERVEWDWERMEEEDRLGAEFLGGYLTFYTISNFLYFLCYHYTGCAWRLVGARKPHIMTGALGGTVVAWKPDYLCILP